MRAIVASRYGGPEVMEWTSVPDPSPQPGEVLVRLSIAGVNFMDTGARKGPLPGWSIPTVLGVEGTGSVIGLGAGVRKISVGDRVAWYYHRGSYAELLAIPTEALVPVPDAVPDEVAAAVMMQGLTANHFTTETYAIQAGDTAVVHAAAGGVGQMLTQMIKAKGGSVIGIVSREEKVPVATDAGADHVLVAITGFEDDVKALTDGVGADVVYDGGGEATFGSSQQSLRRHGVHAYYGVLHDNPTLTPRDLPNSILLSYPTVADHVPTPEALQRRSAQIFDLVRNGNLTPHIGKWYALSDAATAHTDIESRQTTGKLLLVP